MQRTLRPLRALLLLCLYAVLPLCAEAPTDPVLSGAVLDPTGAAIPHATVHLHSATADRTATADDSGHFTLTAPPATYSVTVDSPGFRTFTRNGLVVAPARNAALNITLQIATDTQEVSVSGNDGLSTDAADNKSAMVFKEDKLDTFSDDPAIMLQQLQALGGIDPTDPPQLYVDGFSGGQMPPKNTIREIRINQNPFSAQYDQFGNSRIEIFTKPGTNQLHGGFDGNFSNSALNSRNPFSTGPQPENNTDFLNANINGPLGKHSSFFLSGRRFGQANNAIINAVTLDSSLAIVNLSQAVPTTTVNQTYSLRFDRQFGASDTLIARYTYGQNDLTDSTVGQFVLPSQGSFINTRTQTLQLTDTHLFGAKVVLDSGFQYIRTRLRQDANSSGVARVVQGAFSDGGNPGQSLHDNQDRLEFQEYLSISHGTHFIRTGVRYRLLREANLANAGYNGQFVFPNITAYQITEQDLKKGYTDAAIRADCRATGSNTVCGGATQFSISKGIPTASMITGDIGVYGEDEWKVKPNFSLIYGLRLENETGIPTRIDVAPRVGLAWSIVHDAKGKKPPVAVIRADAGIFYQRFPANNILQSIRQNGTTQQAFFVTNPCFYTDTFAAADFNNGNFPAGCSTAATATPSTSFEINPHLHSPQQFQGNVSAEHSFGKYGNIAANYYQRRSVHQFESRNINAPLPGTYDPTNQNSGVRPLGGSANIYQYSSDGISNGHTFTVNTNLNLSSKLSGFAFFAAGHQETDTQGGFPSNSYDLGMDAGRAAGYSPRQYVAGVNAHPGKDIALNLFFLSLSPSAFNITTGTDLNGDTQYNDRPSFATDLTRPSVVRTAYGNFDTAPLPGQTIIPINYGSVPGIVYLELATAKNFRFGPRVAAPAGMASPAQPANSGKGGKAELPPQKYRLNIGVEADNPLNHVNRGAPVGVLSSPLFGQSTSLNNRFYGGNSANRALIFHAGFYF